jgi:putative ABC transport system permease protein
MITESLLLAVLGGALGVVLANWGIELLVAVSGDNLPSTAQVKIDAIVLAFTVIVSLVTGVLFGLAPALRTMRLNLSNSLKESGRSVGESGQRNLARNVLVVIESAVAVVLLVGAGLLVRSLIRLQNTSPGFNAQNVLTMRLDLPFEKYGSPEKTTRFFQELETRVAALPGVESVGLITELPLSGQPNDIPYSVEGRPPASPGQGFDHDFRRVNTQYFKALQIPLLRGRNFTEQEVLQGSKLLLISDLLAQQVFPNEEPIGRRLVLGIGGEAYEIIGVVGDIRHSALESEPAPAMYLPTIAGGQMNLVIRAQGDPANLAAAVRHEVKAIDPDQPVSAVRTMDDWVATSVSAPRYRTSLLALFALVAVVLASTGIYGVMSYSVAQRTHEIGVRMALGANRLDVLKLVVKQGMSWVGVGILVGLLGAVALTRVMSSLLFEVTPKDPLTFTSVALFLAFVAFVACYIPARRATRVDPLIALRYE